MEIGGRYRLDALVGRGGMGEVHRAFDTLLRRHVALKLVLRRHELPAAADGFVERTLREARAAAALNHPNVVGVYDVGVHEGCPYVVMELVEGRPLRVFVGDERATITQRCGWLLETARALDAAHRAGLVHRDVKPDNVIVRSIDGLAKVLDFGIARATEATTGAQPTTEAHRALTSEGVLVGTPAYMAPEQLRAQRLDGRADQFAWGVMAYELLTGALPWHGGAFFELAHRIATVDPPPLVARNGTLPLAVERAVLRALAKGKDDRFTSMAEVADVLEAAIGHARVGARIDDVAHAQTALARTPALHAPPTPDGTPDPTKRGILDHPLPVTESRVAADQYRRALYAFRAAQWGDARDHLDAALAADPTMSAALLRRAMIARFDPFEPAGLARELFKRAVAARATLLPRDRALMRTLEPLILFDPPDRAESRRRGEAMASQFPGDAELLTVSILGNEDSTRALSDARRATEIDPGYVDAWQCAGEALVNLDRVDEGIASLERAIEESPTSSDILWSLAVIHAQYGHGERAEVLARRRLALGGSDPGTRAILAGALYARTGRVGHAREALRPGWPTPGEPPTFQQRADEVRLEVLGGDWERARQRLHEWANTPALARVPQSEQTRSLLGLLVAAETGDLAAAGRMAVDHLESALAGEQGLHPVLELEPLCLAMALGSGAMASDEARVARGAWLASAPSSKPVLRWGVLYGPALRWAGSTDSDLASEAARSAPDGLLRGLAPGGAAGQAYARGAYSLADVGHALLAMGRVDGALRALRVACSACLAPSDPFRSTYALFDLGVALVATGERDEARRAFTRVIDRWGRDGSPSLTAARAALELRALGAE